MRSDRLVDAIGKIDAVYVQEAELWRQKPRTKPAGIYVRLAAAAACLVLVLGGAFAALHRMGPEGATSGSGENMPATGAEGEGGMSAKGTGTGKASESAGMQNGQDAASGGIGYTAREKGIEIPEEITEVTVTHWKGGAEHTFIIEGTALIQLRQWMEGLILGEAVAVWEGEAPKEDRQAAVCLEEPEELFFFHYGKEEFSYRKYIDSYLVSHEIWYPVADPVDPPLECPADSP